MIKKIAFFGLLLLFLIISGCSSCSEDNGDADQISQSSILAKASTQEYTQLVDRHQESFLLNDGYHGVIRVFSRHYLVGINQKDKEAKANYFGHGAGGLFSYNGRLYVLTAKHVVIPNAQIKEIKTSVKEDPITFKKITSIQSEILIGGLSVQPNNIIVSQNEDFCIMSIEDKDKTLIMKTYSKDRQAPIAVNTVSSFENISGMDVEAWGFPAQHNPQIERVLVSASNDKFISLNKALLRGYSGGPVFLMEKGKTQKDFVGIIIRADDTANQSIVLPINKFSQALSSLSSGHKLSHITHVNRGGETTINNVKYNFLNYYN